MHFPKNEIERQSTVPLVLTTVLKPNNMCISVKIPVTHKSGYIQELSEVVIDDKISYKIEDVTVERLFCLPMCIRVSTIKNIVEKYIELHKDNQEEDYLSLLTIEERVDGKISTITNYKELCASGKCLMFAFKKQKIINKLIKEKKILIKEVKR